MKTETAQEWNRDPEERMQAMQERIDRMRDEPC